MLLLGRPRDRPDRRRRVLDDGAVVRRRNVLRDVGRVLSGPRRRMLQRGDPLLLRRWGLRRFAERLSSGGLGRGGPKLQRLRCPVRPRLHRRRRRLLRQRRPLLPPGSHLPVGIDLQRRDPRRARAVIRRAAPCPRLASERPARRRVPLLRDDAGARGPAALASLPPGSRGRSRPASSSRARRTWRLTPSGSIRQSQLDDSWLER